LCVSDPLFPWKVTFIVPGATELAAVKVTCCFEPAVTCKGNACDVATPEGRPLISTDTVPLKEFNGVTEIAAGVLVAP
jgi:hypothetical protein